MPMLFVGVELLGRQRRVELHAGGPSLFSTTGMKRNRRDWKSRVPLDVVDAELELRRPRAGGAERRSS